MWVALFDEDRNDDGLLLVNFTTLRDDSVDETCILEPADYPPFIKHKTTIAYSMAKVGKRSQMVAAVRNRLFLELNSLPPVTLGKIIAGARASDELSKAKKALLPQ